MRSADKLRTALADRVSASWIALGGQLEGPPERTVIDIEALIAATARLGERVDSRTREVALGWCVRYGAIVSGTRLTRVAQEIGAAAEASLLASVVAASGGPRWPLATAGASQVVLRDRVIVRDLEAPSRLVWRLRAAVGASSRADILAILLLSPVPLSVAEIARRARYTKHAIAVAIEGMALSGVVEAVRVGREDRVAIAPNSPFRSWAPRARREPGDRAAAWRVGIEALDTLVATEHLPAGARAVERRAVATSLRSEVIAAGLPRIDTAVAGERFAEEFERWAEALAEALRSE